MSKAKAKLPQHFRGDHNFSNIEVHIDNAPTSLQRPSICAISNQLAPPHTSSRAHIAPPWRTFGTPPLRAKND